VKHWGFILAVCLLTAACNAPDAPSSDTQPDADPATAPAKPSTSVEATPEAEDVMIMEGAKPRFYTDEAIPGEPQTPSFELDAPKLRYLADGTIAFENATATVYGSDGSESLFEAGEGVFDQANETATLSGGVAIVMGEQRVELESIAWENENRRAVSDTPLTFTDSDTKLEAQALRFEPDAQLLLLNKVTGSIQMGKADEPARMDIEQPAEEVVFNAGRPERITAVDQPLAVAWYGATEGDEPLRLNAHEITFAWPEDGGSRPTALQLAGGVVVDSPQGRIQSEQAQLDLASSQLVFENNVEGKSEQIERFTADHILYDLESGGSLVTNLEAWGLPAGGAYSGMDVQRAPTVRLVAGRPERMVGGVSLKLTPANPAEKPMTIETGAAEIAWNESEPGAIQLTDGVRIDSANGTIQSAQASLDTASQRVVFTGNVRGSSTEIKSFRAKKLTYNMASDDITMTEFTAQDLPIKEGESEEGENAYTRMDVHRAPEVVLRSGKLESIRGGVEITLRAENPDQKPLNLMTKTCTFAYGEAGDSPERVKMEGGVVVESPMANLESETAVMDMASREITFSGDVSGSHPAIKNMKGSTLIYNMDTGDIKLRDVTIDELDRSQMVQEEESAETESTEEAPAP
jgi:lipopolysaccharide assembly outer membrane protein LptD (OstA)